MKATVAVGSHDNTWREVEITIPEGQNPSSMSEAELTACLPADEQTYANYFVTLLYLGGKEIFSP